MLVGIGLEMCAVGEPAAPVLTDRLGIGHLVGLASPKEPSVGDVDLDLAENAEQIADKQGLEG